MTKQVLVIDDDQNTVKYLSVALSEHGYGTVSASNGNDGLRKIRQSKPDLIVLDVMMPGRSGFVLVKQLKMDERLKDIPVLMLSGVGGVLDEWESHRGETFESPYDTLRDSLRKKIQEMHEDGMLSPETFMEKPVSPDSFIHKVQEMIGA
jgi:two-component system, OmpR family, response regulator